MRLYIKYMVSRRCILAVKYYLDLLGIKYTSVNLGIVQTAKNITVVQREQLKNMLLKSGLELIVDKKAILIEQIKIAIIELVHYSEEQPKVNLSDYLSQKLGHSYTYLANLFSESKGITIEHYMIVQKIERVKELILYDEMTLTEISYLMHYSSVAHLSNQFKKVTGLTPSYYKTLKKKRRNNIENL